MRCPGMVMGSNGIVGSSQIKETIKEASTGSMAGILGCVYGSCGRVVVYMHSPRSVLFDPIGDVWQHLTLSYTRTYTHKHICMSTRTLEHANTRTRRLVCATTPHLPAGIPMKTWSQAISSATHALPSLMQMPALLFRMTLLN